jgi:FkbM family methyltransferase
MSLVSTILDTGATISRLRRIRDQRRRRALMRDALRIHFKYLLLVRLLHKDIRREKLLHFQVQFFDYECFWVLFHEIFVPQVYFFESPRPDPLIFDCGANIGMSVLYFKSLYPEARIVAFEPDPVTFEMLRRNVAENNLKGVELRCEGLGEAPGEAQLHYLENRPGWLSQSALTNADSRSKTRSIKIVALSTAIAEEVTMLKMDTEGYEFAIASELAAAGKLSCIRQMVMEYHHHMNPDEDCLSGFLSMLENTGFGYQLSSNLRTPFEKRRPQYFMLYAYRK